VVEADQESSSDHMILDRLNAEAIYSADSEDEPRPTTSSRGGRPAIAVIKLQDTDDDYGRLSKPLVVYIDGPFGAPTSQIFRAQHAVLIGTGIGVTPFASILQSIMHRYWQARNTCPKCQYKWTNNLSASVGLNLRKVNSKKNRQPQKLQIYY
jgi:NAD(P)H-flavin reductase